MPKPPNDPIKSLLSEAAIAILMVAFGAGILTVAFFYPHLEALWKS